MATYIQEVENYIYINIAARHIETLVKVMMNVSLKYALKSTPVVYKMTGLLIVKVWVLLYLPHWLF